MKLTSLLKCQRNVDADVIIDYLHNQHFIDRSVENHYIFEQGKPALIGEESRCFLRPEG